MRYTIDSKGYVTMVGELAFDFELTDEPFSIDDFQNWQKDLSTGEWKLRAELLYKYFLIPLDLVPNIAHYAGFVKETFSELIFDVILDKQTISVEGVDIEVPTNQVKLIPCNCTHWTEEGLMLLDAVIENWNTSNPNKVINFQVKFESFEEFKTFRDGHIQL